MAMGKEPAGRPLAELLTKSDAVCLLELIHESLSCTSEEAFRELMLGLKEIVPYEYATSGLAAIDASGIKESFSIINIDYPEEWLDLYVKKEFNLVDPIVLENFTKFSMQYWQDTYERSSPPKDFLSIAEDFGLKNGYTYGMKNLKGTRGSLFSISGLSIERHERTATLLKHVVPHLHLSLERLVDKQKKEEKKPLSERETEVLKWVASGKSSWDISVILGISERTVNFHVYNAIEKLDAVSRLHAVAIALELGLIEF